MKIVVFHQLQFKNNSISDLFDQILKILNMIGSWLKVRHKTIAGDLL